MGEGARHTMMRSIGWPSLSAEPLDWHQPRM